MTDMTPVEIKGAIEKGISDLREDSKKNLDAVQALASAAAEKASQAEVEIKKFGSKFGDTESKQTEIAGKIADVVKTLQDSNAKVVHLEENLTKAVAAIEKMNAENNAPGRNGKSAEATEKEMLNLKGFLNLRHFGETDGAEGSLDDSKVGAEQLDEYKRAKEVFWKKAMRMPARVPMVEHGMSSEEIKALAPLQMRKSINTYSNGSRYWLSNEMYGEIVSCYDAVTDLSRMFGQVSISRGALEVMKDNDVEKRALFKCEIDCAPGKAAGAEKGPGTVVIQTHEMYDRECITHTMLEDSEIDLEQWLVPRVAEGFSRGRNEKFMRGTGTGEPEGLLKSGNHLEMPAGVIAGSPAGQFTWQHLRIMPFQLAKKFHARGSYMMSRDALMSLFTMADGDGKPLIDNYLRMDADGVMRLWGYPVTQVDQMDNYLNASAVPIVGSKPIGFGDWRSAYLIVDRKGFFVVRDPAYNPCGVTWHFGQRTGGGVLCENASVFLRTL